MRVSKAGRLGRGSAWASVGVLAGCQVVFGIDPDTLPAQSAMGSAGASSEPGGEGASGLGGAQGGGGQAGGAGSAAGDGPGGSGEQGGSGAGGSPPPESDVLATGAYHTCVRDQGVARCWGYNWNGELGIEMNVGTPTPNPLPALVGGGTWGVVRQFGLGIYHSCALREDGRVLCWGYNLYGQLGHGTNAGTEIANPVPTLIDASALGVVRQLATGYHHNCALREDGRVLCWGRNKYGQLGHGTNAGKDIANPVPTLVDNSTLGVVRQLALGFSHSCALRDDGRVLCWGHNLYGQLGTGTNAGNEAGNPVPALVEDGSLNGVEQLALGAYHACVLRNGGGVLCWGLNNYGQLGNDTIVPIGTPNPVPALVDASALGVVRQLALGALHSCTLREDGRVLCWGYNLYGQLGNSLEIGPGNPTPVPTLVDDGALGIVRRLATREHHNCALREDGHVLCWGRNKYGQLGHGTNAGTDIANPVPTLVEGLPPLVP